MKMQLVGKTALVTGASSGIGRGLAKALAKEGVRVAVSARRADALASLADEIEKAGGARPEVLPADLSKRGKAAELAARATAALGRVDILVNNAGVGIGGAQHIVGDDEHGARPVRDQLLVGDGAHRGARPGDAHAWRRQRRQRGVYRRGDAHAARRPLLVSKAALSLASETMRLELRGSGVNVFSVLPGPVETGMLAEYGAVPGGSACCRNAARQRRRARDQDRHRHQTRPTRAGLPDRARLHAPSADARPAPLGFGSPRRHRRRRRPEAPRRITRRRIGLGGARQLRSCGRRLRL